MKNSKSKILIVEDEDIKRAVLEEELREAGYAVAAAANPLEAAPLLEKGPYDLVLTDLRMPGVNGLDFLRDVKRRWPGQEVIVMTAFASVETAVEAMKLGAFDYLQKPFSTEELLLKMDRILQLRQLADENEALRQALTPQAGDTRIVGQSGPVRSVLARIHAVADTDTSILITGESGTGKELAARVIHETSHRARGPFVAVSCAALPKDLTESELFGHEAGAFTGANRRRMGRFELADQGTLFLDDVDDIPLDVQVKLLRVLQERAFERVGGEELVRVSVRVVAATKKSLEEAVAAGQFREDLFYRLNVVPLRMPPLRERGEDIPLLADHFLKKHSVKLNRGHLSITPEALAMLRACKWPGNVRQLEHVLERAVALTNRSELGAGDFPDLSAPAPDAEVVSVDLTGKRDVDLDGVVDAVTTRLVRWALNETSGNLARAAEMLHVPRTTLQYRVSKLQGQAL